MTYIANIKNFVAFFFRDILIFSYIIKFWCISNFNITLKSIWVTTYHIEILKGQIRAIFQIKFSLSYISVTDQTEIAKNVYKYDSLKLKTEKLSP